MTCICTEMISLFRKYADSFGLPDELDLEKQCEFEEAFLKLICKQQGHSLGADQCNKPQHDFCYRCNERASELGYARSPTWNEDKTYVKVSNV